MISPLYSIFMIRHKPTGAYLPARKGKGFSHDEPKLDGGRFGPRIFVRRINAERALTAWLQGVFENDISDSYDFGPGLVGVKVTPQPGRKREEMEIVEFILVAKMTAHPYPWDWLFIEAAARHGLDSATDFATLISALARCGVIVPPGAGVEDVRRLCAGLCDEQLTG